MKQNKKLESMIRVCLGTLLVIGLNGCFVQSIRPFFTPSARISLPQIVGEWDFLKAGGDDMAAKKVNPWAFSVDNDSNRYDVVSYNGKNIEGNLKAVFFKVGDVTFCDFTAGDPADASRQNEYWVWNVRPVHTLTKVELNGDSLTLRPLDYQWLTEALKNGKVSLPSIKVEGRKDELPLFTASSKEWEQFLKKNGKIEEAFSRETSFVFKKRQGKETSSPPK